MNLESRNTLSKLETTNLQPQPLADKKMEMALDQIPSSVLKRLIEEVKFESRNEVSAYNRTHNRHNRGR
jgi:hypothetical protein